jgi:hypothetical protein
MLQKAFSSRFSPQRRSLYGKKSNYALIYGNTNEGESDLQTQFSEKIEITK